MQIKQTHRVILEFLLYYCCIQKRGNMMTFLLIILLILFVIIFGKLVIGIAGLMINKNYMYKCGINNILRYSPKTRDKIKPYILDLLKRVLDYSEENYSYKANKFSQEVELIRDVTIRCIMYVAPDDVKNIPSNLYSNKFEAIAIAKSFLEEYSIIEE